MATMRNPQKVHFPSKNVYSRLFKMSAIFLLVLIKVRLQCAINCACKAVIDNGREIKDV